MAQASGQGERTVPFQWRPESSVKNGNGGSRKTHRKCVLGFGVLQRESIKLASARKGRVVACRMGTLPAGPEPVCCDIVQKPPSLVFSRYRSAWDAMGPGCPMSWCCWGSAFFVRTGLLDALGPWCCWGSAFWYHSSLGEIVSGLLTLSTFPFTTSRDCSFPFTSHVGEAQPLY